MIYDNPELIARQRQQKAIQKLMQRKPSIPDSQRVRQEPQVEITPTKVSRRLEREKHKFTGFKKSEPSKSKGKIIKSLSKGVKSLTSGTYSKRLSSGLLASFSGQRQTTKGSRSVGRPKGVYRNPAGVPAQVWYKIQRQQKRLAQIQANQRQLQIQQQMARQGITPQQAQQIQLQRQLQARQPQQVQMQPRQMPTQQVIVRPMPSNQIQPMPQAGRVMPSQQPSIWRRQGYIAEEIDILGNRRQVVRGTPESFWN